MSELKERAAVWSRIVATDFRVWWRDARLLYSAPLRWEGRERSLAVAAASLVVIAMILDTIVRVGLSYVHSPMADAVFRFGHWYGTGKATLYAFLVLYAGGLVLKLGRARLLGVLVAESYVLSGVLTLACKSLFGRWRPYTGHGSFAYFPFTLGPNDHLSLPSGHATVAFALSAVMAGAAQHRLWKIAWYALAIITALSRIYHDQHWLSDVLLSTVIGTSVGIWLMNNHFNPLLAETKDA